MKGVRGFVILFLLAGSLLWTRCGGDREAPAQESGGGKSKSEAVQTQDAAGSGLTEFELKHGIGPIKEKLQLGKIDPKLVKKGEKIFEMKCAACHELDGRRVGPPLRDVVARRTPEFVMNMMLNPSEMIKRHPVVKQLLQEYLSVMTFQNLTVEDARAVLEYLRWAHQQKAEK